MDADCTQGIRKQLHDPRRDDESPNTLISKTLSHKITDSSRSRYLAMMVKHNIEHQTVAGKMENLQQNTSPRTKHAMFRTWASDNKEDVEIWHRIWERHVISFPIKGAGAPHCARVQQLQRAIPDARCRVG
jgi:hypothetical protein